MSKEMHSTKESALAAQSSTIKLGVINLEQDQNQAMLMAKQKNYSKSLTSQQQQQQIRDGEECACADALDYAQFAQAASKTCLNSTAVVVQENGMLINLVESEQDLCALNERKRNSFRSLSTITELDGELIGDKHTKLPLIITSTPAISSKGFNNTFRLLQQQVQKGYMKAETLKHNLSTDLHISNAFHLETSTTRFELELLARQRIDTLWHELAATTEKKEEARPCGLLSFLFDFSISYNEEDQQLMLKYERLKNLCKFQQDQQQEENAEQIKYHASLDADGSKCLRVVRNPKTLHDKVLCGNRVSQMTRAYDDIEAVTRLLEEKEKDLELTVQIGKELLTQNNILENRVCELENELKTSNDDRSQLLHELQKKNELIAVLTNDDGSEAETPTLSKSITFDLLQKKVTALQDENKSLKQEATELVKETDDVEAQERKLMEDLTAQLNDANGQYESLNLELERLREENRLQHEQIVSLTARLSEAEMRLHQLTHDNDEHVTLLTITKENQNSLALELVEFKQRYQEVLALLQEAQEQLRKHRKRIMPQARSSYLPNVSGAGSAYLQPESLQSELMESSIYSENSLDSGIAGDQSLHKRLMSISQLTGAGAVPPYKRVFDTVRTATKVGNWSDELSTVESTTSSMPRMSVGTVATGSYGGLGAKTFSYESLMSSDHEDSYPSQPAGVPGAPGAKDLEQALKRLTPADVLARRAMLSCAPEGSYNYDEPGVRAPSSQSQVVALGLRTPDSIMSTGSSGISLHGSTGSQHWRLPEKLQIVKPLEGSQTLSHWSRLATPSLGGLLEERPGIAVRGGRNLNELGMQLYTLSDVEEDVVSEDLPGKQFDNAGCTYTYTTSLVMHPADDAFLNDLTFLSQSQISSRMASASTSRQPSCPPTPHAGLSRKNSCSTFSVNQGLASMLNERGIKAVTPSAINTPAGPNFTPTVTPCNSPEGSPTRCMSPEPLFGGLLSSGADLIRRKLIGVDMERHARQQEKMKQQKVMLSRLERRALRSLKLVEKVESIGLENIIAASHTGSSSSLASEASSRGAILDRSNSPLRNLKQLQTNANNIVDDLHFDRKQIKGVLHKGLRTHKTMDSSDDSDSDAGLVMRKLPPRKPTTNKTNTTSTGAAATTSDSGSVASVSTSVALPSATETRLKQMQRQKSRRQLKNGMAAAQRPDLGTISTNGSSNVRSDLGKVATPTAAAAKEDEQQQQATQSITQAFVGSVSSLLFGRKGGWL